MFSPDRIKRKQRRDRLARSKVTRHRRRSLVEKLEPRLVLSVTPVGAPILHNDPSLGVEQSHVRVAAAVDAPQDIFVTVFESPDRDGDGLGVFAQIHSAANIDTIQINSTTTGDQSHPDVAIFADGSFAVTWQGPAIDPSDGMDVFFRRFDRDGNELTPETRVNTTFAGDQVDPAIAGNARRDSEFGIVWSGPGTDGNDIFVQFFGADAAAAGNEQMVNTTVGGDQVNPDIAIQDGFVQQAIVVWEGPDIDGTGIFSQRMADNAPDGGEVLVNQAAVTGNQRDPRVTIDGVTAVSFIGPYDGVSGLEGLFGAIGSSVDDQPSFNDFVVSQSGLNPLGGHDVAVVDQDTNLQFVFGWTNGNQITLAQYEGLNFTTGAAVPTFAGLQIIPADVDAIDGLTNTELTHADLSFASTLGSSGTFFTDGLILASNPMTTATGNNPARQTVAWDLDISPERLVDNIDAGFPARVTVFDDLNGDGIQDPGEDPIEGAIFFVDSNGNGRQDALLPLEQFTVATDSSGEALIYNDDGLIPMSPLLDESTRVTTETMGALVTSYVAQYSSEPEIVDIGSFNPTIVNFGEHARLIARTGAVSPEIRFTDAAGDPIDGSDMKFQSRAGDFLTFKDEITGMTHLFAVNRNGDTSELRLLETQSGKSIDVDEQRFTDSIEERIQRVRFNPETRTLEVQRLLTGGMAEEIGLPFFRFYVPVPFLDPPQIFSGETLLDFAAIDAFKENDSLLDIIVAVRTVDGSIVLRAYRNLPFENRWDGPFEVGRIEGDGITKVTLRTAQLGKPDGSQASDECTDLVVIADYDDPSETALFTLLSKGDGTFTEPTFATNTLPAAKGTPGFADINGDGLDDAIIGRADGRFRLLDGYQIGSTSDPGTIFGFMWTNTYDLADIAQFQAGGTVEGFEVVTQPGNFFYRHAVTEIPESTPGLNTAVGWDSGFSDPRQEISGRISDDSGNGLDGVPVHVRDQLGNKISQTVSRSHDVNGNGTIESSETGLYEILLDPFAEPVTVRVDVTGGFFYSLPSPNLDFDEPESGEYLVDPTQGPFNNLDFFLRPTTRDYGDAPDTYFTLETNNELLNGAYHFISPSLRLGFVVDGEFDGAPSVGADGDDLRFGDDEDGVRFTSNLTPGSTATLEVLVSGDPGLLDAWIDFDGSGTFDPGEQIFASEALNFFVNPLGFPVPGNAVPGPTYARFRLSSAGGLTPINGAPDGEVEDYTVSIITPPPVDFFDYGDAPLAVDSGFMNDYPTRFDLDGAAHLIVDAAPYLGAIAPDADANGQPTAEADGDDMDGNDDEDGVTLISNLVAAAADTTASVGVEIKGNGKLDAWIDFDADGLWDDVNEQIFDSIDVSEGQNILNFPVPGGATAGLTGARFRLSTQGDLDPTGAATDGEVEDYFLPILGAANNPDVTVGVVNDDVTIESGSITVRSGSTILFQSEVTDIGSLSVEGTDADETVTIDLGGGFQIPAGGLNVTGGGGVNSLRVVGDGETLDLTNPLVAASNFQQLDLSAVDVNTVKLDAGNVAQLSQASRMVTVMIGQDDKLDLTDATNWRMTDPIVNGSFILTANNATGGGSESLQAVVAAPWQNFVQFGDVDNSGEVEAFDALLIINELGVRRFSDPDTGQLQDPMTLNPWPGVYFDQSGENEASAFDALRVINELARLLGSEAEAESIGRPALAPTGSTANDASSEAADVVEDVSSQVSTKIRKAVDVSGEGSRWAIRSQSAPPERSGTDEDNVIPAEKVDAVLALPSFFE